MHFVIFISCRPDNFLPHGFGKNQCLQPLEATRDRRAASHGGERWAAGTRASDAQNPDSAWDFKIETIAANCK